MLPVLLNTAAITANPQNAPTQDHTAPITFPTSCFCSFLYPRYLAIGVGNLCNGEGGTIRLIYRSTSTFQAAILSTKLILNTIHQIVLQPHTHPYQKEKEKGSRPSHDHSNPTKNQGRSSKVTIAESQKPEPPKQRLRHLFTVTSPPYRPGIPKTLRSTSKLEMTSVNPGARSLTCRCTAECPKSLFFVRKSHQ